jgi:hypothetical protein
MLDDCSRRLRLLPVSRRHGEATGRAARPDRRPIDDEFNQLSPDEPVKATDVWRKVLAESEPIDLGVSTVEPPALGRAEAGG